MILHQYQSLAHHCLSEKKWKWTAKLAAKGKKKGRKGLLSFFVQFYRAFAAYEGVRVVVPTKLMPCRTFARPPSAGRTHDGDVMEHQQQSSSSCSDPLGRRRTGNASIVVAIIMTPASHAQACSLVSTTHQPRPTLKRDVSYRAEERLKF